MGGPGHSTSKSPAVVFYARVYTAFPRRILYIWDISNSPASGSFQSWLPLQDYETMMGTKWLTNLSPSSSKSVTRWIPSPLFFKNKAGFLVDFQETMERS